MSAFEHASGFTQAVEFATKIDSIPDDISQAQNDSQALKKLKTILK